MEAQVSNIPSACICHPCNATYHIITYHIPLGSACEVEHDSRRRNKWHDDSNNGTAQSFYQDPSVSQHHHSHHRPLTQHPHDDMELTDSSRVRYVGTDFDSDSDDDDDDDENRRQQINSGDDGLRYGGNSSGGRGSGVVVGDMVAAFSRDKASIEDNTIWGDPSDALMNNVRKFRQRLSVATSSSSLGTTLCFSFFSSSSFSFFFSFFFSCFFTLITTLS